MLILLSQPDFHPGEAGTVNDLMARFPELLFHLRKPGSELARYEQLLNAIDAEHYPRVVLHQHYDLSHTHTVKGVHLSAAEHRSGIAHPINVISTSFHSLEEAVPERDNFTYFFCSPVFPSISKPGHKSNENWDITKRPQVFREKAVALGGIDIGTIDEAKKLGFLHFAVLGAVWHSPAPESVLEELFTVMG